MIFTILLILTVYTILIISFIVGFDRVKIFKIDGSKPKNLFSIIIPFRNETKNLPNLLNSLSKLDYPTELFEIILVNDESTDDYGKVIHEKLLDFARSDIQIINNIRSSNSPKKDAIETAINQSKYDWIVTTDADCIVPKNWLKSFDEFIQKNNPKMICAPVTYSVKNSFLEQFQLLDFISLIGSTIGSFGINKPFMCNGANLCYSKFAFIEVDGFNGNKNIASGDDVFLLEKMNIMFPNKIHFLKSIDALVITKPQPTIKQLISQRIRWASKTSATKNWFTKLVGISVLLMNLSMLFLIILSVIGIKYFNPFIISFGIKFIIDFVLIKKTLNFTKQSKNIIFYPIIAFFYPFLIIFIAFLSFLKKSYKWKSRGFIS